MRMQSAQPESVFFGRAVGLRWGDAALGALVRDGDLPFFMSALSVLLPPV
jgi:hypothetical protein